MNSLLPELLVWL